jgi:ABC-type nitrate/sulfonate/bicarbonate transport system permease component
VPTFAETAAPVELFVTVLVLITMLSLSIRVSDDIALVLGYRVEMHKAMQRFVKHLEVATSEVPAAGWAPFCFIVGDHKIRVA